VTQQKEETRMHDPNDGQATTLAEEEAAQRARWSHLVGAFCGNPEDLDAYKEDLDARARRWSES
jgi:hypothetical protein